MTINQRTEQDRLYFAPVGRLDTMTAWEFEKTLTDSLENINELVLDLTDLIYVSSAGLRAILKAHKIMSRRGGMKVIGVGEMVSEIFEVTGFADMLTIE